MKEHPEMVISGALVVDPSCDSTDEKNADLQLYADAVKGDPVGKLRGLVTAFQSSGQRRANFHQNNSRWKHRQHLDTASCAAFAG